MLWNDWKIDPIAELEQMRQNRHLMTPKRVPLSVADAVWDALLRHPDLNEELLRSWGWYPRREIK